MLFIGKSYKQSQAEIGQKIEQMLSKTLRLNFCYFRIIHIFHSLYRSKVIRHTLIKKQKNMYSWYYASNYDENEDENEK